MKGRYGKREPKKEPGVFRERKRKNKAKRSWVIAMMLGGKEWADKVAHE